ncbi:MAG: hypothetical protein CMN30_19620 [Sandaracinus sp.]|nr:hypothetical protein [Sandaracinus sp.]|tara:strand:- start:2963 stop:4690 length:1728 start_codon:yes stop_codon:yes gene_type:complete
MLRFVLLGLLVGACAPARSTTPSGETVAAEPAPSAYTFPERDRLRSALDSAPAPDRIFDADGRSDAPWTLEVTLPPLPEQAPHEAESGPGRLVTELTAARAATATDGAQCLAAALAAHVTTHGGRPSESRRGFIASRCGVVSPHIEVYGRGWSGVSDGPDAALWAQVQGEVRPWAESQVPDAPAHVGLAMARSGDQAALVLVVERPRVQLETVRPMPDESGEKVIVRGRLLMPTATVQGFVNQGPVGVARCHPLPGLTLPEFALECPMDGADAVARIDVMAYAPNRALGEPAAHLLARRPDADVRAQALPDVGEPAPATDAETFARLLVERVNGLRAAHRMRPLELAEAQSATMTPAMGHFFAPDTQPEVHDLIALTMLAGWEVGGTIADAILAGGSAETRDAAQWLARSLDRPMMRATLMDPEANRLAIASVVEEGGIAAMAASYELYDPARSPFGQGAQRMLERIARERAARGLPPLQEIPDPQGQLAAEVDRARTGGKAPNLVLQAALQRASREWGTSVQGMVAHVGGDPYENEVPAELLQPGPLRLQAASTFIQPEGSPWGQWLVVLLVAQ